MVGISSGSSAGGQWAGVARPRHVQVYCVCDQFSGSSRLLQGPSKVVPLFFRTFILLIAIQSQIIIPDVRPVKGCGCCRNFATAVTVLSQCCHSAVTVLSQDPP